MKRARLLFILLAALLTGGGWYGWRLQTNRAIAQRHLPAAPNLGSLPAALRDSLTTAEARAHSLRHAPTGLAELSALYHANGFYAEAAACYTGLQQLESRNPRWPHLHAAILADFGRLEEALPLRRRAVELAPDYLPARLRLGDVLLKANQPADAALAYQAALDRAPGNPYALLGLARCDIAAGEWSRASGRLQDAVARHPEFIGALSLLVTVSERLGESAAATELRSRIGQREFTDLPDPWIDTLSDVCFDAYRLSVSAVIARAAGSTDRALELLARATALAPSVSSYHRQAGHIQLGDRNFTAAKRHLEQAVAVNPGDSDAWLLLLNALRSLGQSQAAVQVLNQALTHCPQSAGLHLERARWLKATGRLPEAIEEFRVSHNLRPSEATPLVELANTYLSLDRATEGLAALHEALARQPGHPHALVSLTFYHILTGDEATALRHWEEIRRQPRTPETMIQDLRRAFRRQFNRDLP